MCAGATNLSRNTYFWQLSEPKSGPLGTAIFINQTKTENIDLIWSSNRSNFHFYISASFVCNNLDNTVRRDYHNRCKKWKNAWGDKPECCTKCQSNWRTCYDECNEEIDLTPPGNIVFFVGYINCKKKQKKREINGFSDG